MSCRHHVVRGYTPFLFVALVASYYQVEAINGTLTPTTINDYSETTTEIETATTSVIALDVPTGLTSIPHNSSAIELSWNPVHNADGYRIRWRVHNDIKNETIDGKNTADTSCTINGLLAWTEYNFSVVATRDGSTSEPAITVNRTLPDAPCPPGNIRFDQSNYNNTNRIVLAEWTEPNCTNGPLDGYKISWRTENSSYINNSTVSTTIANISNLEPWTVYEFYLVAYNEFDGGKLESEAVIVSVRTNPSEPGSPINLTLEYNATSVHAKWLSPNPTNGIITGYKISLEEGYCESNQSNKRWQTTNETEYFNDTLHPATNYTISVYAFIEWDEKPLTGATECEEFKTDNDYPSCPSYVTCTDRNSTAISISWKEPKPMSGEILNYTVYYRRTNSLTNSYNNVSTRSKTVILNQLEPYTEYEIRVSAWTSKGEGNLSEPMNCNTTVAAPCPPGNMRLRKLNDSNTKGTVMVEWTEPNCTNGPLDGYKISWKSENSSYITNSTVNRTTAKISNLEPWTVYEFYLVAYNEFDGGKLESEAVNDSLRTNPSEPGPPINLTLERNETSVHVKWLPPNPTNGIIAGYNVSLEQGYCESNQSNKSWKTTNQTEYFNDNLHPAAYYTISVYAFIEWDEKPLIGATECRDFRTDDGHPSSPSNLTCAVESSIAITVSWDKPKQMRGEISNYTVSYWEINPVSNHSLLFTSNRTLTLDQLEPYTQYKITVAAWTSKGQGNWSAPVTCRTNSAVPNAPSEVNIGEITSTTILVMWNPSEPYPGPTTYYVTAEKLRNNCKETPDKPISEKSNDITHELKIANLEPYTEYGISVVAETTAGRSKPTSEKRVWTLPSEPSTVDSMELNCNTGSSMASVSWFPPTKPNGVLQSYIIECTGTRDGKEDDKKESKINVEDPCESNKVEVTVDGLLPEHNYRFKVYAKVANVKSHGSPVMKDCVLPAGFPPPPQKNVSVVERLKEEIIFVLQKDTFLDTKGDIVEYAVVVAEAKNIGFSESGGRDSEKLPNWSEFQSNGSVLRYQATPEKWNPFTDLTKNDPLKCERGSKNVTCTLGCQVGCDVYSYCNGPLKPGMSYGFKIRGYTRKGFAETLPVVINTESEPKNAAGNIVTAIVVTTVVLSALGAGVFLYCRYGSERAHRLILRLSPRRFVKSTVMPRASSPPNEIVTFTSNVIHTRPVKLSEFSKHVGVMMSDSALKFSQEFEELKSISPSHPCTAAQLPDNRPKNRWINILPYDHSRVKLLPVDDEPASDYINGSYIPGFACHREYIATQGPLPGTVDDMWRMIWEQGVNMIVMLTQCVERGKTKCEQYWPAEKQNAIYGDLQVQTMCESILSEYTIRTFDLSLGSRHRVITHLHFTKWPDFGCPENTELLINFVRAVRDHMSEGDPNPLLVHCSAGVGRTGTFIAVDRLMQHILIHDYADIFQSVLDMREHRTNMVQTEDQYIYIHECVRDLVQDKLARGRDSLKEDQIYGNVGMNSTTKV